MNHRSLVFLVVRRGRSEIALRLLPREPGGQSQATQGPGGAGSAPHLALARISDG
jgi:hypothetical protein